MRRFMWMGCLLFVVAAVVSGCASSDAGITTAVKSKLVADDTVKAYQIDVDTVDRVVTLSGSLDNPMARERAVQLARATDGVDSVVDHLVVSGAPAATTGIGDRTVDSVKDSSGRVEDTARDAGHKAGEVVDEAGRRTGDVASKTGAVVTDAALTSAVKTKFLADTTVSGLKIDVDTKDSIVTLSGPVRSSTERQRAVMIARETSGVRSVVDKMRVEP